MTTPAGTPPAGTPPAGTPPAGTPPAGTPPAGTPPAGTPPAAFDWKGAGLDDAGLNVVTTKQWKSPADMLGSYTNLEKLVGAPPEQIIKLPKEMNDTTMGEVYDRLGRPKTPAEYKLPVPDGVKPDFAAKASEWFHGAGLSAAQALKVTTAWNEHVAGEMKAQTTAYNAKVTAEKAALQTKWGGKLEENVATAKNAAKAFGMTEAQIAALEQSMGYAGVHEFLHAIGSKIGEAEFVQGGGKPGDFKGTTPEAARAKIAELKNDRTFVARWNSNDPVVKGEARAEMKRYEQIAYPGQSAI